ncbi:MAG: hypothetical protein V4684_19600 [Pseudomonadota bacterium]
MQFKSFFSVAAVLLISSFALQEAQAQAAAPAKEPRLVNRDELRVCMNTEAGFAPTRSKLDAQRTANSAEVAAIRAESAELAKEAESINEGDDRKQRAFKRKVDAHNARVQASNAALQATRTELEAFAKTATAYNEQCAGITFRTEDKEAILKEREAAPK